MDPTLLQEIVALLRRDSINYSVFLRLYESDFVSGKTLQDYVSEMLLRETELYNIETISADAALEDILDVISYEGDSGAGPSPAEIGSPAFAAVCERLSSFVKTLAAKSDRIERFRFLKGHPAYPVFWEFAYLYSGNERVTLFIGSSSD